jgi:hypothetical protein
MEIVRLDEQGEQLNDGSETIFSGRYSSLDSVLLFGGPSTSRYSQDSRVNVHTVKLRRAIQIFGVLTSHSQVILCGLQHNLPSDQPLWRSLKHVGASAYHSRIIPVILPMIAPRVFRKEHRF